MPPSARRLREILFCLLEIALVVSFGALSGYIGIFAAPSASSSDCGVAVASLCLLFLALSLHAPLSELILGRTIVILDMLVFTVTVFVYGLVLSYGTLVWMPLVLDNYTTLRLATAAAYAAVTGCCAVFLMYLPSLFVPCGCAASFALLSLIMPPSDWIYQVAASAWNTAPLSFVAVASLGGEPLVVFCLVSLIGALVLIVRGPLRYLVEHTVRSAMIYVNDRDVAAVAEAEPDGGLAPYSSSNTQPLLGAPRDVSVNAPNAAPVEHPRAPLGQQYDLYSGIRSRSALHCARAKGQRSQCCVHVFHALTQVFFRLDPVADFVSGVWQLLLSLAFYGAIALLLHVPSECAEGVREHLAPNDTSTSSAGIAPLLHPRASRATVRSASLAARHVSSLAPREGPHRHHHPVVPHIPILPSPAPGHTWRKVRVAVLTDMSVSGPEYWGATFERAAALAREARKSGPIDVIVFPETQYNASGPQQPGSYALDPLDHRKGHQNASSSFRAAVSALAMELSSALVVNILVDPAPGHPNNSYNAAELYDAAGTFVARHYKQHLAPGEGSGPQPRPKIPGPERHDDVVVDGLGLQVCYDMVFPSGADRLVRKGAVLIAVPVDMAFVRTRPLPPANAFFAPWMAAKDMTTAVRAGAAVAASSTTGLSFIATADGRVRGIGDVNKAGFVVSSICVRHKPSPAISHNTEDFLAPFYAVMFTLCVAVILYGGLVRLRYQLGLV